MSRSQMHSCTNTPHNRLQALHPQAFILPNNRRLTSSGFPMKQSLNPLCPFIQPPQNAFLLQPSPMALVLLRRDRGSALVAVCISFGRRCRRNRESQGTTGSEGPASMTPFWDEHLTFRLSMLTGQTCCKWFCAFPWSRTGTWGWSHWVENRVEEQAPITFGRHHALERKLSDRERTQKRKYLYTSN